MMRMQARTLRRIGFPVMALLFTGWLAVAGARELAFDIDDMLEAEVGTVAVEPATGAPVVLLREPSSGDIVPIFIGPAEARAILESLSGMEPPRPMTHDLAGDLLDAAGARIERVFIDDLVAGTFLAMVELTVAGEDEPVRVDSRASDAIALALRAGAAVHISPKVLEAGRQLDYEALEDDPVANAAGITVMAATDELREALDLPDMPGVLVSGAAGPAADAGIAAGALLLEVDGATPHSPMEFLDLVRGASEGVVRIAYWREGEVYKVELPTDTTRSPRPPRDRSAIRT